MDFTLILSAPKSALYEAFSHYFAPFSETVTIEKNYFQNILSYDCLVSPANSLGKMDGGMDGDICEFFGYDLEKRVQEEIVKRYGSYQPVGTSFIIETGNAEHPFLAHTPTMVFPEDIRGTINPYLAFKAMLLAVNQHNHICDRQIKKVVCSGFGTGTGMIDPEVAAQQMALAYELVSFSEMTKTPIEVFQKEQELLKLIKK